MIVVPVLCCVTFCTRAQDARFSQFYETPLLRNPGLAGIFKGDMRVQTVIRSQWASVTVPYQTGSINGEYKFAAGKDNDYVTLGLAMLYDRAGTINFTTTNVMPTLNYHKALSGDKVKYLSLGFSGGLVQRRIDRSKITTNNQFDGYGYNPALADGETFSQTSYQYIDGSAGLSFNSSLGNGMGDYYLGVAYHHFNTPKNSFYKDPTIETKIKWVGSAGLKFNANELSSWTMMADYSTQGSFSEIILGALYSRRFGSNYENPDYTIHFGGFFRWNDALIPTIKFDYLPFAFALSYDANISTLKTASRSMGGFELAISLTGFRKNNSSKDAVLCPRF